MDYWQQFGIIALVHLLAVASPGPDFAVVVRQSLTYGRNTALWTSFGVGSGILVHVAYSLIGIGLLIKTIPALFLALKVIAASYFLWIAYHGLTAKPNHGVIKVAGDTAAGYKLQHPSAKKAFITGFLVNGLNVKATLFFVSLFSMVIDHSTPLSIKLAYGLYMALATALWFIFVSLLLSHPKFQQRLQAKSYWIDRFMGVVLLVLAIKLLASELT